MLRHLVLLTGVLTLLTSHAWAVDFKIPDHSVGKADAPVVIDEYVSLTCPHCAAFYDDILPELEKKYVDTGQVRFNFHAFVRDGTDLKAVTLAYCMPEEQFFPFVGILFKSQEQWALSDNIDQVLLQYAKLGGLSEDKAKACMQDKAMQDAIVADRTHDDNLKIESTPTFIFNGGVEKIEGTKTVAEFSVIIDRALASKK